MIPIVDLVSPVTQKLIETAYTRDDYSVPSPVTLLPRFNPSQVATDLVNDIPEGINAALDSGLTPLPPLAGTGPDAATTLTATNDTNEDVAKTLKLLPDRKPLTRLSLFAKPSEGITGADGTNINRPSLRDASGNVSPGPRRGQGGLGHGEEGSRQGRRRRNVGCQRTVDSVGVTVETELTQT